MILKLTRQLTAENGDVVHKPTLINMKFVANIEKANQSIFGTTYIIFGETNMASIYVKESVEEIDRLINDYEERSERKIVSRFKAIMEELNRDT